MTSFETCKDSRNCFAKQCGKCKLLKKVYPDGECPFCKEEQFMTNGKYYPYSMKGKYVGGYSHGA